MKNKKKILITGHAGRIGTALRESYLNDKYELSGLDKNDTYGFPSLVADISKDDISSAFEDIDIVIHLAADPREDAEPESILKNNIIGTQRVFEAAKSDGVEKIIFASSVRATDGYLLGDIPKGTEGDWWTLWKEFGKWPEQLITPEDPPNPYNHYGISKVYGENLGLYYYKRDGMSVICFRIGGFGAEKPTNDFLKSVWISPDDLIQGFDKAVETEIMFGIYYLISNNEKMIYDISSTIEDLGYCPKDNSGI